MTQQTVNVGTAPNTGTGDPLRTAFQKINANFAELYNNFGPGFINNALHALMDPSGQTAILIQDDIYSFGNAVNNPDFRFLGSGTLYAPLNFVGINGTFQLLGADSLNALYLVAAAGTLGNAPNQMTWDANGFTFDGNVTFTGNVSIPDLDVLALSDLADVQIGGPPPHTQPLLNGQVLTWSAQAGRWVNKFLDDPDLGFLKLDANGNLTLPGALTVGTDLTVTRDINVAGVGRFDSLSVTHDASVGGYLTLGNDPTQPPQATTKYYVDRTIRTSIEAIRIEDLADVNAPNPITGEALVFDGVTGKWIPTVVEVPGGGPGAGDTLAGLTDVGITTLSPGDVLTWDAVNNYWTNLPASNSLATLTDVALTNLANGDIIVYDSATDKWENSTALATALAHLATLPPFSVQNPQNGQVLTYNASSGQWMNAPPGAGTVQFYSQLADVNPAGIQEGVMMYYKGAYARWVVSPVIETTDSYFTISGVNPATYGTQVTPFNVYASNLATDIMWTSAFHSGGGQYCHGVVVHAGKTASDHAFRVTDWLSGIDTPQHPNNIWFNVDGVGSVTVSRDPVIPLEVATKQYVDANAGGGGGALAGLSDVNLTNLQANQFIYYNGSEWVNSYFASNLYQLVDVAIDNPAQGDVLTYDATAQEWINSPPAGGGGGGASTLAALTDVTNTTARGAVLSYDTASAKWLFNGGLAVNQYDQYAVNVTGGAGKTALYVGSSNTNSTYYLLSMNATGGSGLRVSAGGTVSDNILSLVSITAGNIWNAYGDGSGRIGAGANKYMSWDTTGIFTVPSTASQMIGLSMPIAFATGSQPVSANTPINVVLTEPISIPANFAGSQATTGGAQSTASGTTVYTISKKLAGSNSWNQIGTVTFYSMSAGGIVAGSATSFNAGDSIQLMCTPDSTLAGVGITIRALRA